MSRKKNFSATQRQLLELETVEAGTELPESAGQELFSQERTWNDLLNLFDTYSDTFSSVDSEKLFKMFENDDAIYAAVRERKSALLSIPWSINSENESNASFISSSLKDIIPDIIEKGFWSSMYGYTVLEIVWKKEGNKIVPSTIIDRDNSDFVITKNGLLKSSRLSRLLSDDNDSKALIPEKYLLIRNDASNTKPYGDSTLSRLYTTYLYRCNGWKWFSEHIRRYALPFIVGQTDTSTKMTATGVKSTEKKLPALKESLKKAQQGSVIAIDLKDKVELLESKMNGAIIEKFHQRLDDRINRTIKGQTLTSDTGRVGSYGLGKVHFSILEYIVLSDAKNIEKAVSELIKNIGVLNNLDLSDVTFNIQDSKSLGNERATRDDILYKQGIRFSKKYYEERYDLREADFEIEEPETKEQAEFRAKELNTFSQDRHVCLKEGKLSDKQQIVEDLIAAVVKESPLPIDDDLLLNIIKSSDNEDDLNQNLEQIFDVNTDEFQENLIKGLFKAETLGYLNQNSRDK